MNDKLRSLVIQCKSQCFDINDVGLNNTIDNVIYEIRSGRLTGKEVYEAISETGISFCDVSEIMNKLPDRDLY